MASRLETIVVPLIRYAYTLLALLFTLFGTSFLFAWAGSWVEVLLSVMGVDAHPIVQWVGWLLGAALGAVGYLHQRARKRVRKSTELSDTNGESKTKGEDELAIDITNLKNCREAVAAMGMLILLGVVAGGAAAGYTALVWFSLAMSPFAPQSWQESIEVDDAVDRSQPRSWRNDRDGVSMSSSHPTALRWTISAFVSMMAVTVLGGVTLAIASLLRRLLRSPPRSRGQPDTSR